MLQWAVRDCGKEAQETVPAAKTDDQFGIIIKHARLERRLTQGKLAELVEVEPRTIQRWEAETCIPWPAYIEKIVVVLPEIRTSLPDAIKKIQLTDDHARLSKTIEEKARRARSTYTGQRQINVDRSGAASHQRMSSSDWAKQNERLEIARRGAGDCAISKNRIAGPLNTDHGPLWHTIGNDPVGLL